MATKGQAIKKSPFQAHSVDSWHSREQYGKAANLSLMGWYQVLAYRRRVLDGGDISNDFKAICQDPLAPRIAGVSAHPPLTCLHPTEALYLAGAYSEPVHAERICQWIDAQSGETSAEMLINRIHRGAPGMGDLPDMHRHSVQRLIDGQEPDADMGHFVMTGHLMVDLGASDDVLKAWFDKWLREERALLDRAKVIWRRPIRRGRDGKGKFTGADCMQWARLRVLDYIDIQIACRVQGMEMPSAQWVGAYLFPDELAADTTDIVRQQVKKTADWLMSRQFLGALHTQVVAERMLELARE